MILILLSSLSSYILGGITGWFLSGFWICGGSSVIEIVMNIVVASTIRLAISGIIGMILFVVLDRRNYYMTKRDLFFSGLVGGVLLSGITAMIIFITIIYSTILCLILSFFKLGFIAQIMFFLVVVFFLVPLPLMSLLVFCFYWPSIMLLVEVGMLVKFRKCSLIDVLESKPENVFFDGRISSVLCFLCFVTAAIQVLGWDKIILVISNSI